jgi:rSAM/selenodomain-associated transferase 2
VSKPAISIIIACYHDEVELEKLLSRIEAQSGDIPYEVIVVDGAHTDACETLCLQAKVTRLLSDKACRGYQFNLGSRSAGSDILWFLHADAAIADNSLEAISKANQAGIRTGFFKFEFTGKPSPVKNIIAWWTNFRARLGGMAYGDQGIFMERKLYQECEGHEELPLFDEVRLLRRAGKTASLKMLDTPIGINTRRWDRDGYIKRTLQNRFLAVAYMLGVSVERLNKWYRST